MNFSDNQNQWSGQGANPEYQTPRQDGKREEDIMNENEDTGTSSGEEGGDEFYDDDNQDVEPQTGGKGEESVNFSGNNQQQNPESDVNQRNNKMI